MTRVWLTTDDADPGLPPDVMASDSEAVAALITNRAMSPAAVRKQFDAPKVHFFDVWNRPIFAGGLNKFVTGQNTANRTTTATVAAGATVIPLDSVTNVTAGVVLLTNYGTAQQQLHRVVSVAALNVTVADPVVTPLTNGQLVTSLWTNASHLATDAGFYALAYELANAQDADGAYMIQGTTPKVTLLGNSWFALGATRYEEMIQDRIPGAVVVNAGVGGDTSALMLARFDTDVPSDSDYVVFNEPGVNDVYQAVAQATQVTNLELLVAKIRAIGAIPIYLGPVPLVDFSTAATTQETLVSAQIGTGSAFPAVSLSAAYKAVGNADLITVPNTSSVALAGREGTSLAATTTGTANTAVGSLCANAITSGVSNVAVGRQAMWKQTTGSFNVAVGQGALANNTTGAGITAIGQLAGFSASGNSSTFLGREAGYNPNNVVGNATTTGSGQTCVGYESGQGSATQRTFITCLGYRTTCDASGAVAIGTDSTGAGAAAVAANEIALGTANHTVRVRGTTRMDGALDHDGTTAGFFNVTPVTRPTAYTQTYATADKTHAARTAAALTDNTTGTVTTTLAALPNPADTPATADALRDDLVANLIPVLRNALASLTDQINKLRNDHLDTAQLANSIVDDFQALGLLQ